MIRVERYTCDKKGEWDSFVLGKTNGSFLHTRNFLDYHADKFNDESLLVYIKEKMVAVFPSASLKSASDIVVSHIGSTYGGLVFEYSLYGEAIVDIYSKILSFYQKENIHRVLVKITPNLYKNVPLEDEEYAVWRNDGILKRVDISAYIDISNRFKVSSLRKRTLKLAMKNNLEMCFSYDKIDLFYSILSENLKDKHNATPVHTLDELNDLKLRLGDKITLATVSNSLGKVLAGVLFFIFDKTVHCQYISSSSSGSDVGALDFLFENSIKEFETKGFNYFSFGTSNECDGNVLNEGLYRFKRQFGSVSMCHKFYEFEL